jgi:hypothetical protein
MVVKKNSILKNSKKKWKMEKKWKIEKKITLRIQVQGAQKCI